MNQLLIDPGGSEPFQEVFIWIGHYADGTEGMLSADFVMPVATGERVTRHMPLMSSQRVPAAEMAPIARNIQSASQHAPRRIVRVELRRFVAETN